MTGNKHINNIPEVIGNKVYYLLFEYKLKLIFIRVIQLGLHFSYILYLISFYLFVTIDT